MKRTSSTKQPGASRSSSGNPALSGRSQVAPTSAAGSSRASRTASGGPATTSPSTRRRGLSPSSSTDSRTAGQKPSTFSSFLHRSPATPVKAGTPRAGTDPSSPSKLQSASPRQPPASARRTSAAAQGSAPRRTSQAPALVATNATPHGTAASPQYETLPDPRRAAPRRAGGSAAPPADDRHTAPLTVPAKQNKAPSTATPPPHAAAISETTRNNHRGSPLAQRRESGASSPLAVPPGKRDADDIDTLDMGLAPRLGDLPSVAHHEASALHVAAALDSSAAAAAAASSSHADRRKSSVFSSEHTMQSLLLNVSGATLPPSTPPRHSMQLHGVVMDAFRLKEAQAMAENRSGATPLTEVRIAEASKSPASTAGSSPVKLTSAHLAPSASKSRGVAAHRPQRKLSDSAGASRQTVARPAAGASAGKGTLAPSHLETDVVDANPVSTPKRRSPLKTAGSSRGPASQPVLPSRRVASPHTPTKAAVTHTTPAASPVVREKPGTPVKKRTKHTVATPAAKSGEASPAQRSGTPSGAGTAAAVTSSPAKPSAQHTTLHSQRAAAMLSQMLSVVRPMAPVVHVRIRPVLPTIGESNHQRHVYLLDHENVMITNTRAAYGAGGAAASALLSPNADYAAAKRLGTDTRGGGGTHRPPNDFRSASSSAVLANSTGGGWRGAKTGLASGRGAAVSVGAGLASPTPATLYGDSAALLKPMADSPPPGQEAPAAGSPQETKPLASRGSSSNAPGSAKLQPLSLPGASPASSPAVHPRTTSWLSQGSEEAAVGSRLSGESPSMSPPQLGLGMTGGSSTAQAGALSTPRTRPRLAAFAAFGEDTAPTPGTTPRGMAVSDATVAGDEGGQRRDGRRTSAQMQKSVSLSAMTAPGSRAATRKNSMVSGAAVVSPSKAGRKGGVARQPMSRSALGASMSVSAMSMPTVTRFEALQRAAEDRGPTRSPLQDVGNSSSGFAEASTSAAAANASGANGTEQHYSFEFVHDEEATQADVFEESVLRFADEALLAQNVAIICYGPTGSGKTYSMMGSQAQPPAAGAAKVSHKASNATVLTTATASGKSNSKAASPAAGGPGTHAKNAAEAKRRLAERSSAGAEQDAADQQDRSTGLNDDDAESEGNTWPQLGSSWQYGYTDRFPKVGAAEASSAVSEGEGDGWQHRPHNSKSLSGGLMTSATMAEMGILPRLVHTLLERRGEAITIRRESGRSDTSRTAGAGLTSPHPTPRPASVSKTTSLSLTLRDLTFYGIELYMDELCDLLDPGKRPIQTVGDMGGLAALCQRINEARDYRINGSRGGASQVCATSPRAGGGMPITSLADLRRAYRLAHGNRVTSKHAQNDTSSRSHAIFLLQLDFDLTESGAETQLRRHGGTTGDCADGAAEGPAETVQRVHSFVAMVDLAGCERVKQTKVEGAALREAQYINKSLSALSSVVLSLHRNNAHVPYRDSKLTRLLRPCLEGGRVLTLVHVSPCSSSETVNTLKFADQIRHTHIPTHALTPSSSKHRELLDVFADLIDPMQGQWEAQVRQAQQQLNRLCADVRLAYFSRAVGAVPRRSVSRHTLSPESAQSDAVSDVSAMTDDDDGVSLSPGDVSLEEGPPPLPANASVKDRRTFALHAMMQRLMGPIHHHQRTSMQEAIRAIRRRKEHKITSHDRQLQQRIEKLQAAVQKLTAMNTKLANENRTPLPRDPYALELNRQLRETSEQISETTKEQAALSALTVALRQRLGNQDMLEATVDEQLRKIQQRTAQALQTLSAAAAAHPPGVVSPPQALSSPSSPREPTLPTGSPVPAAIAMETDDDPELRDIAHQQISLARELAALRLETACFEIGTGMWEGLWARAMRKEIVTALEVEVFAMERILLDRRALSLMLMDDNAGAAEGSAVARPLPVSSSLSSKASGTSAEEEDGAGTSRASSAAPSFPRPSSEAAAAALPARSALWARLGAYLQGKEHETAAAETPVRDTAAMPTRAGSGVADSPMNAPRTPPPPPSWRRDRTDLTLTTNSESSETRSTEGQQRGRGTLLSRPGSPSSRVPQRLPEEAMPNPLTVLAVAHDEAARQRAPQNPRQEAGAVAAFTPPPSPRSAPVAPSSSAAVAAALLPLTISGTYGDEQAMQEACLQLLLRDGIPCEACCMGNAAPHVLQHYMLPGTADAPLAEEMEGTERVGAPAASVRHAVVSVPSEEGAGAAAHRRASMVGFGTTEATTTPSPTHPLHARPSSAKTASCTTRFGRLRLARMPRRPNCYVLEFVYSYQGLPMSPRLQAALAGKPEDSLAPTPRKTNLELMVDALPSVHGVAGRGGTRAPGPSKEHRLFAIPLYEPSLHLHLHVLEEGIEGATTPVAATWPASSGAEGVPDRTAVPQLCVARCPEAGAQLVLEVQGVPYNASARRTQIVATAGDAGAASGSTSAGSAKTKLALGSRKQKGAAAGRIGKKPTSGGAKPYPQLTLSGSNPPKASASHVDAEAAPAPAPGTSGWSDLVLAKRLGSGGELMLPSSCILASKGCCSLVLRFPRPFFSAMARTESVEAVVGALCGILRPSLTVPEVRASARTTRSPSKRSGGSRRRRSASPGTTSAGGAEGGHGGAAHHKRRRGSLSHSSLPDGGDRAAELDVITYAHVPYTMFAAEETRAEERVDAAASAERSASSSGYLLPSPAAGAASAAVGGRIARTPSSHSASMARTDSLDGLVGAGGGVLGHTLQSSCSPGVGHRARGAAGRLFTSPPSLSPLRTPSGSTATANAAVADQQNGATLQVQFYWPPTPIDVEPPRAVSGVSNGARGNLAAEQYSTEEEGNVAPRGAPGDGGGGHMTGRGLSSTAHRNLRAQVRDVLGVLAHLSYVLVDGHASLSASATAPVPLSAAAAGLLEEPEGGPPPASDALVRRIVSTGAAQRSGYMDAVAVAALLRQLDTYRQRIRRLFRQQLYDAEDVLGDEVQLSGPDRGAYMRDVQAEVRHSIGLPGGGAGPLDGSPARWLGGDDVGKGAAAAHALLEPQSGDEAPDTQVTVPEAREVCGALVPWTVWQWAYRWSRLRRLLTTQAAPSMPGMRRAGGDESGGAPRVAAAAVWLPPDAHASSSPLLAGQPAATPMSVAVATSAGCASSSSSSSEGYVMEGNWLSEAKFAARSKRVWLPDVLSATLPSYLESCASDLLV